MHILAPYVSCVASEDEFEEAKKTYGNIYVTTKTGDIYRHVRLSQGRHIRIKVKEIPWNTAAKADTPAITEDVNFLPNGKIPFRLLEEIIQFFREVMTIKKAEQEAMAHILYNEKDKESSDRGYRIAIPNQVVSKASVKYESDHILDGDIIALDIHSHNTMGAFFSGTDNGDDRIRMGYSGVVGKLDAKVPEMVFRLNVNEDRRDAKLAEIFDLLDKEIKVPSEWLEKVKSFSGPTIYTNGSTGFGGIGRMAPNYGGWDIRRAPTNFGPGTDSRNRVGGHSFAGDANVFSDMYTEADVEADRKLVLEGAPWARDGFEHLPGGSLAVYRGQAEEVKPSEDPDMLGITVDGEFDANAINHGKDAAIAVEQIDIYLDDLEGIDELLLDVIAKAYSALSTEGQGRLAEKGL